EIRAEADHARAEYAMAIRRLEIELKSAREKVTVHQAAVSRQSEELARLKAERDIRQKDDPALESEKETLESQLQERQREVAAQTREYSAARYVIEKKADAIERLSQNYEEAALNA